MEKDKYTNDYLQSLMRKALAGSLILTVLMVLAYLTKPTEEECFEEAMESYRLTRLNHAANILPSNINTDLFQKTAEKAFSESLEINDRFLYRNIYQTGNGFRRRIGWGIFGWVNVELR